MDNENVKPARGKRDRDVPPGRHGPGERPDRRAVDRRRAPTFSCSNVPLLACSSGPEGRLGTIRFLVSFATVIAAAVLFAWASQAGQDDAIRRNEKAIAVLGTKLDAVVDKLDEIRALLVARRVSRAE